jgi:acetyl-CoA synthetase
MSNPSLSNLLYETRRFDPPEDLTANANVKADADMDAAEDRLTF